MFATIFTKRTTTQKTATRSFRQMGTLGGLLLITALLAGCIAIAPVAPGVGMTPRSSLTPKAEVLTTLQIDLNPEVSGTAFEKFWVEEYLPTVTALPGYQVTLHRGERGGRAGQYLLIIQFASVERWQQLFPADGTHSTEFDQWVASDPIAQKLYTYFSFTEVTDYVEIGQQAVPAAVEPTDVAAMAAAFKDAIKTDDVAAVKRFLEAGADPNLEQEGILPMFLAVGRGNLAMVKLLAEYGGDVAAKVNASDSTSLLNYAATQGQSPIVTYLFEQQMLLAGWDVNQVDSAGFTPLTWAADQNQFGLFQMLIDAGADIDMPDDRNITALMYAAHHGQVEEVRWLIDQGAALDYQGIDSRSALHAAVYRNTFAVIPILIAAGARLDLKNDAGQTPLAEAIALGHDESVQILREAGAGE